MPVNHRAVRPAPKRTVAPIRPPKRRGEHMPAESVALAHRDPLDPWTALLSPRQHQVLDMLVQGLNPATIARTLGISKSAVSKYCTEIKERLDVQTLHQAVVAWHRHYRVLQPSAEAGNKDNTLIANLARAIEQQRAAKKEVA